MEPSKEILINLERLQLKMDEYGMDAVVARAGINYTYLSGIAYPGTLARHLDLTDSPRGTYLIWPRRPAKATSSLRQVTRYEPTTCRISKGTPVINHAAP
jgi:Xaa-Pro aminopeptidase